MKRYTAVELLQKGNKATKDNWCNDEYIYLDKDKDILDNKGCFYRKNYDFFKPVWYEYKEKLGQGIYIESEEQLEQILKKWELSYKCFNIYFKSCHIFPMIIWEETSNKIIKDSPIDEEHTRDMIDEIPIEKFMPKIAKRKYEYPIYMLAHNLPKHQQYIVKFTSLKKGIVVATNYDSDHGINCKSNHWIPHTDETFWKEITNPNELCDKDLIWCWDTTDTHSKNINFYDAENKCTFNYKGKRDGVRFDNYKKIMPWNYPDWVTQEIIDSLEDYK